METKEQKPRAEERTNPPAEETNGQSIGYHSAALDCFESWAEEIGLTPEQLRQASVEAIRKRGHEAAVHTQNDGFFEPVYALAPDNVTPFTLFFTKEANGVEICGYAWDIEREPLDDYDGGGFYRKFASPEAAKRFGKHIFGRDDEEV